MTGPSHTINSNTAGGHTFSVTSVSGYTAIGVVGFQNNAGGTCIITACYLNVSEQTIFVYTKNVDSVSHALNEYISVLYVRNGFDVNVS